MSSVHTFTHTCTKLVHARESVCVCDVTTCTRERERNVTNNLTFAQATCGTEILFLDLLGEEVLDFENCKVSESVEQTIPLVLSSTRPCACKEQKRLSKRYDMLLKVSMLK